MEGRGSATGHLAVVAMVLVLVMAPGALAANHVVGGVTQEWQYPPTNDINYYTDWAKNQTFAVGDTLQFEYSAAAHNVWQLSTLSDYTACTGTAVKTYDTGNDSVPLTAAGTFYYICGVPGHCTQGMKFTLTVGAAATPPASPPTTTPSPPTTTPSPPAGTTPPPPPKGSAASSGPILSMAGLLVAAVVASLAFLV